MRPAIISSIVTVVGQSEATVKRNLFAFIPVVAGLAFVAGNAAAQTKSLKDQLLGMWTFVSWEETRADGSKHVGFGTDPKGVLFSGPDGRFMTIQMRSDLPKVSSNDPENPTPAEARALAVGSLAYFGTYEAAKSMSMHVDASTSVNLVGRENKRIVTLISDKELRFRNSGSVAGGQVELVWKRD